MTCLLLRERTLRALAGRLAEAEALEVEKHLQACARCHAEQQRLRAVTGRLAAHEPRLTDTAALRIVAAVERLPASLARRPLLRPAFALGLAAAAALAVVAWATRLEAPRAPAIASAPSVAPAPAPAPNVPPEPAPSPAPEHEAPPEPGPASLVVGPATVWPDAGAVVEPIAGEPAVRLREGRITVEVEPGHPFRVVTKGFVARVLGTRFVVDLAGVRVERGRVAVEADGRRVALLAAGQAWSFASAPRVVVADVLDRARSRLGSGDGAGARRELGALRAARLDPGDAAEAGMVRAESFMVERRWAAAAAAYHEVARGRGPAAETALYTAARLEAESLRRSDAARRSIDEYLRRYPAGRFVREARALQALGKKP